MEVAHYQGCMHECQPVGQSSMMELLGVVYKRWGKGRRKVGERRADSENPIWDSESTLSLPKVQRTFMGLALLARQSETCIK